MLPSYVEKNGRLAWYPFLNGFQSGRFALNELWNEGVGQFFRKWESLMSRVEHLNRSLFRTFGKNNLLFSTHKFSRHSRTEHYLLLFSLQRLV